MSCVITIYGAFGQGDPITGIEVTGTSQECPDAFEGDNIEVTLICDTSGDTVTKSTDSNTNGDWSIIFSQNEIRCACGVQVTISARCLSDTQCPPNQISTTVSCEDCPTINLTPEDDVPSANVKVECDMDGSVLVSVAFNFLNTAINKIVQPVLNPGPGGTLVSQDSAFVTPGASFQFSAVCRYNPIVTPNPKPFIEFMNAVGFEIMACPPVPFIVPPLPECEVGVCPASAVLEVTDSEGNIVIVSGTNAVLCLLPGTYTVTVISPLPQPSLEYFWSVNNTLTNPLETGQSFDVDLSEGVEKQIGVAMSVQGCPPLAASVDLEACVINCEQEVVLELRDSSSAVIGLNGDCIAPGNYTLRAAGPTEPPWDFKWTVNGQINLSNTTSELPISIVSGTDYAITVEVSAPGCEDKTDNVTLSVCQTPDNDDDKPGCGTLLLVALGLMIAGMIGVIVGVCTGFLPVTIGGGIIAAVGLILFLVWLAFCTSNTSCSILNKARCLMQLAGWIFAIIALILTIFSGIGCGFLAVLSGFGWFGIATIITDFLVAKGCTIESCY